MENNSSGRILFSRDELEEARTAVWAAYCLNIDSARALWDLNRKVSIERDTEAKALRNAFNALEILMLNSEWIEAGLRSRMVDRRK
jgi:hypothetical protein